jgi:hypothetical protein
MTTLLDAARQALEALERVKSDADKQQAAYPWDLWRWFVDDAITALRQAIEQAEQQEPVATKQMLRWVEHLKRLSDDGQHMSIPGLSSGACWELAIELEQFIKNTTPPQRKPLTDEEIALIVGECAASAYRHDDFSFARAIERAHGIGGGE